MGIPVDLKYRLYEKAVQNHEADIEFLNKEYKRLYDKVPLSLSTHSRFMK